MTDRKARKAFVKFCREQKESWLVCTVDREQLFWIWQAATMAERERCAKHVEKKEALEQERKQFKFDAQFDSGVIEND